MMLPLARWLIRQVAGDIQLILRAMRFFSASVILARDGRQERRADACRVAFTSHFGLHIIVPISDGQPFRDDEGGHAPG